MGQVVLDSGKIWAGLAILEDGFDQTAELHAVRPADILRREPRARRTPPPLLSAPAARSHQRAGGRCDRQNVQRHRHGHQRHRLPRRAATAKTSRSRSSTSSPPCRCAEASHGNAIGVGPGRLHHPPAPRRDRRAEDVSQQLHDRPHGPGENPRRRFATTKSSSSASPAATAKTAGSSFPTRCTWKRCTPAKICATSWPPIRSATIEPEPVELTFQERPASTDVSTALAVGMRRRLIFCVIAKNRQAAEARHDHAEADKRPNR